MLNRYEPQNIYSPRDEQSDDEKNAVLKFTYCHKNYPLNNLNPRELKKFIEFAKKVEREPWKDIKFNAGLDFKSLHNYELPSSLPKTAKAQSMKVDSKFRVVGWREKEFFNIVYFDNTHKTT